MPSKSKRKLALRRISAYERSRLYAKLSALKTPIYDWRDGYLTVVGSVSALESYERYNGMRH